MTDVVIVGGGVIGLTAAWELAERGVRVSVLDQSEPGTEASWAGAGMIPPAEIDATPEARELAALSTQLWPKLSETLLEETGVDNGYRRCGGLHVDLPAGVSLEERVLAWRRMGVSAEIVGPTMLREMEPQLTREVDSALFLPTMAQVRNPRHLRALKTACIARGVSLLANQHVTGWDKSGGRVIAAVTATGRVLGDQFIVASGAWTSGLVQELGIDPRIRPIRGQIVLLQGPRPLLRRVIESGTRYLVPRDDGRILIGSTEEDVGFDKRTTETAISELIRFGVRLVPAISEFPMERAWAGLRPRAERGRPWIGRLPGLENVYVAAGHFRSGLLNSPATAQLLREMILGEELSINVDAFDVSKP